jgi:hypothetical protein
VDRHLAELAARAELEEGARDFGGEAAGPALARILAARAAREARAKGRQPERAEDVTPISLRRDAILAGAKRGKKVRWRYESVQRAATYG